MNYAIELYFDDVASMKIEGIRQHLRLSGITVDEGAKPHMSLAIYSEVDEKYLIEKIRKFAERKPDFSLILPYIGIFPTDESVIFLAPKVTTELLSYLEPRHD